MAPFLLLPGSNWIITSHAFPKKFQDSYLLQSDAFSAQCCAATDLTGDGTSGECASGTAAFLDIGIIRGAT